MTSLIARFTPLCTWILRRPNKFSISTNDIEDQSEIAERRRQSQEKDGDQELSGWFGKWIGRDMND